VQRPQLQRVEWECAELALCAHKALLPVRAPFLSTALARAAEERRIGRLCSERAACRGMHVLGIERGGAAAGLLRYSQRGPRARDVTKEYSRGSGTPPMGTVRGDLQGHKVAVGAA
jgi:hypothetical protein